MHEPYLKQALALAEIRRGFCAPNPSVGAVVVKDNQVIATGFHWASGHPHAEVDALNKLFSRGKDLYELIHGATLYVTLEPCCHYGKTPPCTDLIIKAGIKCVVYGMCDPNPQVANKSQLLLTNAGIETIYLPLPEIELFYRSYHFWWRTQRPYVTAKIALSLDGKIAGADGQRIQLTGATAKQFTHEQRKCSDALLTTARTIYYDDPWLNVRLANENYSKPIYILDRQLTTPLTAKIFQTAEQVILLHANATPEKIASYVVKGAYCIEITTQQNQLNLDEVLQHIGKAGVHDLWIEAGGRCFTAFIQQNLLQRAFLYVAPIWLGEAAQTAFACQNNIFQHAKNITWRSLANDGLAELIF